ncbi:hypothetical protein [Bradyrhizobium sp. SYSU BS000235]|uniref:hypothetical protein n=1 Tax=Bradyrhizobium sp. SYSU BS000235 TaxID=3411332 RepID=UPI003C735B4B
MLSRALILAAVTVVLGYFAAIPAEAQNLEAGKSPGQIFSSTCSLCHKSPRGLLKSVGPGSLPGFLRQHYTTSTDMASAMSAYVLSNGAANAPVGGGNLTRQGQEAKSGPRPSAEPGPERAVQERERAAKGRKPHTRETTRPADAEGPQEGAGAPPDGAAEAPPPEHPSARHKGKQKATKGRPAKDEPPKIDARHEAPKEEPPKAEPPKAEPEKSESAKGAPSATEAPKREEAAPSVEAKPDPAPAVTPAAPKEPEKGPDAATVAPPAVAPPAAAPPPKPVEDNPNRPLTIDMGSVPTPPPAAVPSGDPTPPASK